MEYQSAKNRLFQARLIIVGALLAAAPIPGRANPAPTEAACICASELPPDAVWFMLRILLPMITGGNDG